MSYFHFNSHKTGFLLLSCTPKERIIHMCDAFFLTCPKGKPLSCAGSRGLVNWDWLTCHVLRFMVWILFPAIAGVPE